MGKKGNLFVPLISGGNLRTQFETLYTRESKKIGGNRFAAGKVIIEKRVRCGRIKTSK